VVRPGPGRHGAGARVGLVGAAHRLGLSHSTVKHHLANARSKVGATTAQLVWILAPRLPPRATIQAVYGLQM
jgi:hypothetical protein